MLTAPGLLFGFVVVLSAPASPADRPAVDIRGAGPKPGIRIQTVMRSETKDMAATLRSGDVRRSLTIDRTTIDEGELTLDRVEGTRVTKLTFKLEKGGVSTVYREPGSPDVSNDEESPLVGGTVISEEGPGGWKHRLAQGEITEEQAQELANRMPPSLEDDVPAGLLRPGATWSVPPRHIAQILGPPWPDATGKVTAMFVDIKQHHGEPCAVIRRVGTVRGEFFDEDGSEHTFELDVDSTEYRSLRYGVAVDLEHLWTIDRKVRSMSDGEQSETTMKGKSTHLFTAKVLPGSPAR